MSSINNIAKKFCLLIFTLGCVCFYQIASADEIPAVWVWKVTGGKRDVYLAGEFHSYSVGKINTVNYELGLKLYDLAGEVLVEAATFSTTRKLPPMSLATELSPATWKNVQNAVNELSAIDKEKNIQLNVLKSKLIAEIEHQSAFLAYLNLNSLSGVQRRIRHPDQQIVNGLTFTLRQKEKILGQHKITEIEPSSISDDAWRKECPSAEISEKIVSAALSYFNSDSDYFSRDKKFDEMQKIFINPNTTEEEFSNYWISLESENNLILRCNIVPRNAVWLPKIIESLDSSGSPVFVLAGLMHMLGNDGLLAQLKVHGFAVQRIYFVTSRDHVQNTH